MWWITHIFPNFSGATIEVWEWISSLILHLTGHVTTNSYWWHQANTWTNVDLSSAKVARCCNKGPLLLTWFKFNPSMISNYIHYKMWDEITYIFPNFSGATIEVWEWISSLIPHLTGHVTTNSYWWHQANTWTNVDLSSAKVARCCNKGPLLLTWFKFNPSMISNYIHYKMWDEITYPFLNFNGATAEV